MAKGRMCRMVLVFLLMGAAVNLGIAWALVPGFTQYPSANSVKFRIPVTQGFSDHQPNCWLIARIDRFGTTIQTANSWKSSSGFPTPPSEAPLTVMDLPPWSRLNEAPSERLDSVTWRVVEDARGWPLRSFIAIYANIPRRVGDSHLNVIEGVPMLKLKNPRSKGREYTAMPLRPIWSGVLVNTLLYASVLWLLWGGPIRLRRARRAAKGHSLRCGYDLTGAEHAGCPECGWNRESLPDKT
jgi:hypothetical protein